MRKIIIGVMGPGERAREDHVRNAFDLGRLIAQEGWIILSGGRNAGVMDAASRGAKEAGGLTIGILPTRDRDAISPSSDGDRALVRPNRRRMFLISETRP